MPPKLEVSEYVGTGDSWIRWRDLLGTVLGSLSLAAVGGVSRLGNAVVRANARLLEAAESFLEQLLLATVASGADVVRLGWRSALLSAVDVAGPLGAPLLVVLDLLVIVGIAAWTADRVI